MIRKKLSYLGFILFFLFLVGGLFFAMRGHVGNPSISELSSDAWRDNGPLELSPERGRYGLMYSLVEDSSLTFSIPIARFIVPDCITLCPRCFFSRGSWICSGENGGNGSIGRLFNHWNNSNFEHFVALWNYSYFGCK